MTKWNQTRRRKLKQTYGDGPDVYVGVDCDGDLTIQIHGKHEWLFLNPDEIQAILNESKAGEQKSPVTDIESEVRMIKQEIGSLTGTIEDLRIKNTRQDDRICSLFVQLGFLGFTQTRENK